MSEEYKTVHMRYDKYVEMCGEICDLRNLCSDYRGTLASAGAYQQELEEQIAKIVHCKDCKYCDRHHLVDGLFCYRLYEKYNKEYPQMIIEVDADDFCSRGERK